MPFGCLSLAFVFIFAVLFPFILAGAVLEALAELGLSEGASLLAIFGVMGGSLINIPLKKIPRGETIERMPVQLFGLRRFFPRFVRRERYTIIAVNVGGCLVPCSLAIYELVRIGATRGSSGLLLAFVAVGVNTLLCYLTARPVPRVGIAMVPFVPALVAALSAVLLLPDFAPPLAFAAGVLGPVIGGDLLHLRDISKLGTGMASIGGAGTFDGIVLSGLVATLLA